MIAQLCVIFGTAALVLAATGLYGVLSYSVVRRTNEIGIRMALGAGKGRVIFLVLRETGLMVAAGMAVDALLTAFLYTLCRVTPLWLERPGSTDHFSGPLCILIAVAAVAGYVPAWRAARVNPMNALRYE
jgi:ABC-type antimicrobial peptide transport system permease subunit